MTITSILFILVVSLVCYIAGNFAGVYKVTKILADKKQSVTKDKLDKLIKSFEQKTNI